MSENILLLMQDPPTQVVEPTFIDPSSLMTLGGAIVAVVVIVNTSRHVFQWGPRWFALVLSIIVSVVVWNLDKANSDFSYLVMILMIIINGCLIYTSAFGIQNTVIAQTPVQPTVLRDSPPLGTTFRSQW